MICSSCGAQNRPDRKFCLRCGTPLAATCPSCGAANEPEAGFCGECGQPLAGGAGVTGPRPVTEPSVAPAAGAGLAGLAGLAGSAAERRLVSVLFADLVGFTTLAEGRDPEETRELLSRYFELARDVIGRYGGTVEKFIGDAVMAVWGAPSAHEDDAERAVRAGLELVDAVRGLGPGLQARAGVMTGEAAITIGAVGQGLVAGDLVNTASRLQSVAAPGTLLVDEATRRAASRAIAFEEAGPQDLRGKTAPVTAHRALRVVAQRGGRNRSEALEAPFVGRDEELRLLKDLFHATSRDHRPRLVSVIGPAGIGKSRLAWEFLKYIDGLVETVWWHDGRSPAYGEGITFWALGEMIRGRCGLHETDDAETTRAKVTEVVARWVPDESERRWVEPALLALLGVGEAPPGGRDGLFAAWRTFFERIAAEGTVVMIFEDLHWADDGLLDFIDHVLEWTKGLPLYLVTLARPELLERRPDWGNATRNFTSLGLEPLPDDAMRALLAGLAPGLPDRVVDSIVRRADGIPLYAVETVRMLVSEGRLQEQDGAYRPVGELGALAVPETLQALISARLDGLDAADRSLLQDAAVLGQSFTLDGLAAVSARDKTDLESRLRWLVRRELLTVEADPRSPERGQYAFVQALIREVAYGTLARADRKRIHLAAARWFEELGDEELAGALAGHYVAAWRNASEGAEAEALGAQARVALRGAADRAIALGSYRQGIAFLRQAEEVTTDPSELAALWERIGDAATSDGDIETARAFLDRAIGSYRDRGDRVSVARAASALGYAIAGTGRPLEAIAVLEAALAEADDLDDEPAVIRALAELSRAYGLIDDPRALATSERALAAAERLDLVPVVVEAMINRANALVHTQGRTYEPMALFRGVLPLATANDLFRSQLRAMNNLAAHSGFDDIRVVADLSRGMVELAERIGDRGWLQIAANTVMSAAIYLGRWDEADELATRFDLDAMPPAATISLGHDSATLLAFRGDSDAARATLARLDPLLEELDDPRLVAWQRNAEAQVAAIAGRLEEAFAAGLEGARRQTEGSVWAAEWATRAALWLRDPERARSSLELHFAESGRGRQLDADRATLKAGVAALEGRVDDAAALYRDAIRLYRDLELPIQLGLCLGDQAALLPPTTTTTAGATEARRIFEGLGAAGLLAHLDRLGVASADVDRPVGAEASASDR
jgi:class 3 adenylate cyclase/tetratricopeptide (TPR) repeat protein